MDRMRRFRLGVVLVLLVFAASLGAAHDARAARAEAPAAVSAPAQTAAEWSRLVRRSDLRPLARAQGCRPLHGVFYAATDWLRLATKLAAQASPCAQYAISIPPLVADKTRPRPDQAWRIRALGPSFHALAEIHLNAWRKWVEAGNGTWYQAGVEARRRMAAAGYDVGAGDTWALNELSSAVRRGDGTWRTDMRELVRGLYDAGGEQPPAQGVVFVVGVAQRVPSLATYKARMQEWLQDSAFWVDMNAYVSDWSQEVYGDLRAHAVPGEPVPVRREFLNDYLQHPLVLATAGPAAVEPARSFLQASYSPLANGAWPRETAWGWTMVPVEQMSAYISAQVDAMRYFAAATSQARDHWGLAWAPSNTTGMSAGDFAAQTGQLQDRLAAAIRDSAAATDPVNTGTGACGPPGQDTFCLVDLPGAGHNAAWQSFRTWTQPLLTVAPSTQTVTAGAPSASSTVSLTTATGTPVTSGPALTVTLRSSSVSGTFATSPLGPWTTMLALTVAPGVPGTFYYRDTLAGVATVTAAAVGATAGTQTVTVVAGPAARVTIEPGSVAVRVRTVRTYVGRVTDAFGNTVAARLAWSVSPPSLGTIRASGGSARLTAGRLVRAGTVSAVASPTVAGRSSVRVLPAGLRVQKPVARRTARGIEVLVRTVDGARRPVSRTALRIVAEGSGRRIGAGGTTGAAGKARIGLATGAGCYTVTVTRVRAQGFVWSGRAPRTRVCR